MSKLIVKLLHRDFESFARKAIRYLDGNDLPLNDLYLEILFAYLRTLAEGDERRLIVNMPPRHLKTMAGISLAAWMLGRDPSKKILIVSYGEDLAKMIAGYIRKILKTKWFGETFPASRIGDTDTGTLVTTTRGGYVSAVSFTGSITGQGADLIIVDDPHKIGDAAYPDQIERTVAIFGSTVQSRLNSPAKGKILVLAHRIARNDLSGNLLDEGGWAHLRLPLIAEQDLEFELGGFSLTLPRGHILRENEFTAESVGRLKVKTKIPNFETLHLQNPTEFDEPISLDDFGTFERLPPSREGTLMSVDWAHSERPMSSYSVAQIWRVVADNFYLIDQWRAQVAYDALVGKLRSMAMLHGTSVVLIESGALAGPLARDLKGLHAGNGPMIEIIPTAGRGKEERFRDAIPYIKQRRVFLPRASNWVEDFIDELTSFPNVDHTDQVDASTQAITWLAQKGNSIPPRPLRCVGAYANQHGIQSMGEDSWTRDGRRFYVAPRKPFNAD